MGWLTRNRENRPVEALITLVVVLVLFAGIAAISGIAASAFLVLVVGGYLLNRFDQSRRQKRLDQGRLRSS